MLHMQDVISYNILVVLEFLITKVKLNKWGVKFRLKDQRRNLEVQNKTYMIIAENYMIIAEKWKIIAEKWKIIEEPCTSTMEVGPSSALSDAIDCSIV